MKGIFTFGLDRPPHKLPGPVEYPSIGYLEDETFDPGRWVPHVPNPAFENLTNRDGYWGAKIVAAFTDTQIAAAVRAGKYSNPAAEKKLIEMLEHRRDRIAKYWFKRVAPLDRFHLERNNLIFDDLAVRAGL